MALVQKTNPVGIDIIIDMIQSNAYNHLVNNAGWTDYNSYHRAYLNPKYRQSSSLIPEFYLGSGEYKELYFNDNFNAESYFIVPPIPNTPADPNGVFEADVWLIYQVNLDNLYPSIDHRADEEAHKDVIIALNKTLHEFDFASGIITTIDQVYQGLDTENIDFEDMQDCHVFRIDLKINYSYKC